MKINRKLLATLMICTMTGFSMPALAADTESPEFNLEPMNISANRTAKKAIDVSGMATTVDQEKIDERQASTVKDILETVPGVEFSGGSDYREQLPSIRGLAPVYSIVKIDGARQNYSTNSGMGTKAVTQVDPLLLKSAEVVTGSSSVLHGSCGTGGVISLQTKDARDLLDEDQKVGAMLRGGYQTADNQKIAGVNVYGSDQEYIDVLMGATRREMGNFESSKEDAENIERDGTIESQLVKFGLTPADDHRLTLSAAHHNDEFENKDWASSECDETRINTGYMFNPASDLWDLKTTVQYVERERRYEFLAPSPNPNAPRKIDDDYTSLGFDIQNTSRFNAGEHLTNLLTVGMDYYLDHQEGEQDGKTDLMRPDADAWDLGIFVQDEMVINDTFTLTPALRYTDYSRKRNDGPSLEQSEHRLLPRFSANWAPTGWLNIFGGYAESYRPPSLDDLYFETEYPGIDFIKVVPYSDLKAEKGKTAETGFSLKFDDMATTGDRLRFKALYFEERIDDLICVGQEIQGVPPAMAIVYSLYNADGETDRHGVEAQIDYHIDAFDLSAAYTSYITRDSDNERFNEVPDKLGMRLAYTFADLGLTFAWQSSFYLDDVHTNPDQFGDQDRVKRYNLHDLNVSWTPTFHEALRLDLGIENLFDEEYRYNQLGYNYTGTGRGRNYKAAVAYRF